MGRWPIAGGALCFLACSASEAPVFLDLEPLDRDLVLLASLDEGERIVETALIQWDAPEAPNARVALLPGGRLLGAAFEREALEALSPRLDPDRLSQLGLEGASSAAQVCAEGVVDPATQLAQLRWPEGTRAFEWLEEEERSIERDLGADWWSRVGPSVMIAPNRCQGHRELQLVPFSPRQPLIGDDTELGGQVHDASGPNLSEFVRVDEDWLLVAYGRFVVLAQRGVGFVDAPGRYVLAEQDWRFRSIALGPPDGETGARRVVLVAILGSPDAGPAMTRVYDGRLVDRTLSLGAMLLETHTVIDAAYLLPEDGRLLLYERPGQIYAEDTPGGPLAQISELPGVQPEADKRGRFEASGVPSHPVVLIGSRPNSVYLGRRDHREWVNVQDGLSLGSTHRAFTSAPEAGGEFSLYTGNTAGHFFTRRLSEPSWKSLTLRLDPSLLESQCAVPVENSSCGFGRPKHSWQSFTVFQDESGRRALLAFADYCSVAFVIRDDGCTSSFPIPALGPIARGSEDEIFAARSEAGFVTLATEQGTVFEISWAELGVAP